MKVLYSRMAQGRKKEFQIITRIVLEEGKKYVIKEAVCKEAVRHMKNTFCNEELLEPVYGDYLLRGYWAEGKLVTPYIAGKTFGNRLREYFGRMENDEKITALLRQWRDLITGSNENVCKFIPSEDFEKIFGKADDLAGAEATAISNFDCSAENIFFLQDGRIKIIDYEWVFPFPIPVEMSFYRVLKMFFESNQGLVDWNRLLELAGIDRNYCVWYERMMDIFARYTSVDEATGIDYALMGRKFKAGKIIEKNKHAFTYRFPYEVIPEGSKIVLYGAGRVGEDYYKLVDMTSYCRVVLWTDKSAQLYRRQGLNVSDISDMIPCDYDCVFIAVYQENVAEEIREELISLGIGPDKIVWEKPQLL